MSKKAPQNMEQYLRKYGLMTDDGKRIKDDKDMLECPVNTPCGRAMVKVIKVALPAVRMQQRIVGNDAPQSHRWLIWWVWDMMEVLYYG